MLHGRLLGGRFKLENCIFLSASVPDPIRAPEYSASSNSVAITSAVRALVHVTLGRRVLVWGGHPAITPMIKVVAEEMGVDYGDWVKLYQSSFFEDKFPEDNKKFKNVVYTENIQNDLSKSLFRMRECMFHENKFNAAVFIGGMGGIVDEFNLFHKCHPGKNVLPVTSTGGATLEIEKILKKSNPELLDSDLNFDMDYVRLFHRKLGISPKEERFTNLESQPDDIQQRYWKGL